MMKNYKMFNRNKQEAKWKLSEKVNHFITNQNPCFGIARKPVFTLLILLSGFLIGHAQNQSTGTSANGTFTITKLATATSVPAGGASVTYIYTIKNISNAPIYYQSITDNKIANVTYQSGFTSTYAPQDILRLYPQQTLTAGASATFIATQTITQTTTNTVTATLGTSIVYNFFNPFDPVSISGNSVGSTSVTVTVLAPAPGTVAACGTLWYSTDVYSGCTAATQGTIGTITNTGVPTSVFTIKSAQGTGAGSTLVGSAAMAVDPSNPDLIYYVPRTNDQATFGGLYQYSQTNKASTIIVTGANTPNLVRLGVAADGTVWAINTTGGLISVNPPTNTFTTHGTIVLPANTVGAPTSWTNLQSGDLTFDGTGTMYFIGSNSANNTAYLYSLSAADLNTNGPTATLIGNMGAGAFNGIAFTNDGTLYASTLTSGSTCNSGLYTVNITTGSTTLITTINNYSITDLGSCALPQPALTFTKTASQSGTVTTGTAITYTLTANNIGTLLASNVALQDAIPTGSTYVPGSTKLNGTTVADKGAAMPYATASNINSTGAGNGIIASGSAAVITFQVLVTSVSGSLCNQGNITYTGYTGTLASDNPSTATSNDPTCLNVITNVTVSGNVYDDNNGPTGGVNGTPLAGDTVRLYLAGVLVSTSLSASDGSYTLTNALPGAYTVVVTPPVTNPAYQNVSSTGTSQTAGSTAVTVAAISVTGVNFGLHQPPTAIMNAQSNQANPGGTKNITVPSTAFSGTDPNNGTISSLTIPTFPSSTTSFAVGTTTYYPVGTTLPTVCPTTTCTSFPAGGLTLPTAANGNPTSTITLDPIDGIVTPAITYTVKDAAGLNSPTSTVSFPFTTVLPLNLISFTGSTNNCNVNLGWVTANEQNFNYFDVQYSIDGVQFTTIGKINGKGGNVQNVYNFETNQGSSNGLYRLSMVDKDGSIVLSNTLKLSIQCAGSNVIKWNVYSNPVLAGSAVNLMINNNDVNENNVHVVVMSLLGQKLLERAVTLQIGVNNAVIPSTNLLQGSTYLIGVYDTQGKVIGTTQKLLIK